eukprot:gene17442-17633_t
MPAMATCGRGCVPSPRKYPPGAHQILMPDLDHASRQPGTLAIMTTISLPPRCDRAAAEALLPEMIAALGSGPLVIDARDSRAAPAKAH